MIHKSKYFKYLLAANYLGIYIQMADGHWHIECEDTLQTDWNFGKYLKEHGIQLNSKIYNGPLQALATIDEAFRMVDGRGILEHAYTDNWYMGSFVIDDSRLDKVEPGEGYLA